MKLLTRREAAEALRVSKATITNLIRRGVLRPVNLGIKRTLIPETEVMRLMDGRDCGSVEEGGRGEQKQCV